MVSGAFGNCGVQAQTRPEVVEERAAECGMEEVVGQGVLLGQFAFRQIGRVVVAHHETGGVAPGNELIHLAAIDLILLLIVAVDEIAGDVVRLDVLRRIERGDRQVRREARIGHRWLLIVVDRLRQGRVGGTTLIDLLRRGARIGEAVRAGEIAIEAIEAPVLLIHAR